MVKENWQNLKDVRCPWCGHKLEELSQVWKCEGPTCAFRITKESFDHRVAQIYKKKDKAILNGDENLSALNNWHTDGDFESNEDDESEDFEPSFI